MIISQTPYRVSFAGGGTDIPAFYQQEPGAVLSVAINQHMYVTVSPRFDASTRVAYTKTEVAESVAEIQHTIVREALRQTGLGAHLEITTVGDVPAGTGLGSSSSLAVGLLNALYAYNGEVASPEKLARQACEIEIDILNSPIGRQDQYAAAFGSMNFIQFNPDHSVFVEPVPVKSETISELEKMVLLIYTQQQRETNQILARQSERYSDVDTLNTLRAMKQLAFDMRDEITGAANLLNFAELLHQGWELKRSLCEGITDPLIDHWYQTARAAGALGGKLLGAGGGGFLMLIAPTAKHAAIREKLGQPRELAFAIDRRGSRIIFISDRYKF